jgi:hypothetical protein
MRRNKKILSEGRSWKNSLSLTRHHGEKRDKATIENPRTKPVIHGIKSLVPQDVL